jgi:hypothetical protein
VTPLLVGVRASVELLLERCADEDAAVVVGDRDLVARAVARAALATVREGPALAMSGAATVRRVRALTVPAPLPRRRSLIGPAVLGTGSVAAATATTVQFVALARAWL